MYQLMQYEKRKGSVLNSKDIKDYLNKQSNTFLTSYNEKDYIDSLINDL